MENSTNNSNLALFHPWIMIKSGAVYSKSDSIEIMINDKKDEVIKNIFDSLKSRYQNIFE